MNLCRPHPPPPIPSLKYLSGAPGPRTLVTQQSKLRHEPVSQLALHSPCQTSACKSWPAEWPPEPPAAVAPTAADRFSATVRC